jgi:hypothetical protein
MSVKPLKVLLLLDLRGWTTAQCIAKELNMTPHEVAAQLRILMRFGFVDDRPRKRINGELNPAIYCSIRNGESP